MMRSNLHRQRGAVAIMVAIALLLLLSVVGLVLDAGLGYMVKARLNAAVDSAAVAAARAVTNGNDKAAQERSAQTAAAEFFAANIPDGYLLSHPKLLSTNVQFNGGTVTIDVRAEAPMKVSLMGVLGFTDVTPTASAQTIRRDLDMVFVVDDSGSLWTMGQEVRAAAKSFLNKFNVTQDRVGLVHFGSGAEVDNPINTSARGFDRMSMFSKIDGYTFGGTTSAVEGMWHARDQLKKIPDNARSSLRVIVFFSDGVPNGFGAYFPFYYPSGCPYPGVITWQPDHARPTGLYWLNESTANPIGGGCEVISQNYWAIKNLPDWYNAHNPQSKPNDPAGLEFRIVTDKPRSVTSSLTQVNVGRAARNLAEAVAEKAREEGTYVFTLGMGNDLKKTYDGEIGENVLKCMANVADGPARCYNPNKPVGMYCYAATEADLTPCFSRLASAILRISK
ncbi:vWA domain-containing protein [Massilia sp. YMA4]|uniref:vWA domain-containing protein n=1 Tax=Massilia sp. YMA4 TaxID=1593482 RepID=UPI000DD14055|nr:vWA domain-containing protein [Massilia sp. YMA4]AXA93273.1 VWA domain-containing protein [Massilia sp. YMA4]